MSATQDSHNCGCHHIGCELEEGINDLRHMTGEFASDMYRRGVAQAKTLEKGVASRIEQHPLQSLLIATGLGLLLGAVWTRR